MSSRASVRSPPTPEREFVVVAGDVFEHNQLAPRDVSQSLEAMRAIGIPVYLLPGNHDPLDASSVYTSALFTTECPDNVTVLDRAGVHEVRPGLQIVAAPWRSKAPPPIWSATCSTTCPPTASPASSSATAVSTSSIPIRTSRR